ncbi:MAG: diguanylate cyclase [Desulfobacteraceae bacterium]|nr:diguanylate cyclase [Desulfobacteraceae bacterium]
MSDNVLVVDDDFVIRDAVQQYLSLPEYQAFIAQTAEEALEFLKENTVEVVITDILLSGIDGLELTETVKKKYDTAVIIMTGYIDDYSYEEAIHKGADEFVLKPVRFEELRLRLSRLIRERHLERERRQMREELKKLSITDDLTGLYNSRHFYRQLELEISRHSRYNHPLSLLFIDIDSFKTYNDRFGHPEGDRILSNLGGQISENLRSTDSAYRLGGEEFTVILPETESTSAVQAAERLMGQVNAANPAFLPEAEPLTLSIGVTAYGEAEGLSDLVKRANQAMYMAKEKGKNRVSLLLP